MRLRRARMSWIVLSSTCPMCSTPVTLGGGMTIEKAGFVEPGLAVKQPFASHSAYHLSSTCFGSYALENSVVAVPIAQSLYWRPADNSTSEREAERIRFLSLVPL